MRHWIKVATAALILTLQVLLLARTYEVWDPEGTEEDLIDRETQQDTGAEGNLESEGLSMQDHIKMILDTFRGKPFQTETDYDRIINLQYFKKQKWYLPKEWNATTRESIFGCATCSCAVVGGSIKLRGSKSGTAIDNHDIVIRMNKHPFGGKFAADVGSSCSINVSWMKDNSKNGCNVRAYSHYIDGFMDYANTKAHAFFINRRLFDNVEELIPCERASTGMLTTFMAESLCDRIDYYGFDHFQCKGNNAHYYPSRDNCRTDTHNGLIERDVLTIIQESKL